MRWTEYLTDTAKEVCDSKEHLFHYCCIIQTIGKYIYIHASRNCDTSREVISPLVKELSDSGLLLVASGCLGQMFKLYKNKRPPGLIAPPITIGFLTTENFELGQLKVVLNITQNHSSRL